MKGLSPMREPSIGSAAIRFSTDDLEEVAKNNPRASLVDQLFSLIAAKAHAPKSTPGARLPSVRQLAEDCGLSRDTVARAYERLVAHGIVEARRGSGYFVKAGTRRQALPANKPALEGPAAEGRTRWRALLVSSNPSLVTRTGSGSFPDGWQDEASLSGAVRTISRQSARIMTQYGDARGYLPLRQQLQIKLQEIGIHVEPNQVLVTGGAMEAIHLVCQAFLRQGAVKVLLEDPCPPLLVDRMLSTGMEVYRVPRLSDGPDLVQMREICERFQPTAFFCSSVLHNPTCTQIAPHKAFQVLQLAQEFDFTASGGRPGPAPG
ncbi:aminotransferase class I/II-fold pyridoxal phosphate-dependent enzyme, partial [Ideonella sp. B508-1]|uniref:aminotransferase class I/II-fold pyridoxal phosphate-dependent enzyme n=1 Tax=Ideonella sp. B508-1 TaxID=137716 RepID=UPI0011D1ED0E